MGMAKFFFVSIVWAAEKMIDLMHYNATTFFLKKD